MIESLTDQNHPLTSGEQFFQLLDAWLMKPWFENVVEIFFAEQVKPILTHSAQQRVEHARRESAIGCIEKRPH